MTPIKMLYINGEKNIEVTVYKFSIPDAFGALALCYFEPGTTLTLYKDQVEEEYTVPENGEWQSIHCRYLKPSNS